MRKKFVRLAALFVSIMLIVSMISACGATKTDEAAQSTKPAESTQTAKDPNALDISKPVALNFYLLGPEHKDMATVAEQLNKLSQKDINATVNWSFLGWDKWDQKYNLVLASGEKIDLIFTAQWADYLGYSRKGAFLALDELAPKYAPKTWNSLTQDQWGQTKVGGKIYTVPCNWTEYNTNGYAYRADLREKYGITKPIESFAELEAFMEAAKKDNPSLIPYLGSSSTSMMEGLDGYLGKMEFMIQNVPYAVAESNDSKKIMNFFETPAFEQAVNASFNWVEKAYVPKNVVTNKVDATTVFLDNKSVVIAANPSKTAGLYNAVNAQHPDWKIEFFPFSKQRGVVHAKSSISNGISIPKSCENPERALAFIDLLRNNPEYYNLTQYGVKDVHYTVDANNEREIKKNDKGEANTFDMAPWGWHEDKMEIKQKGMWPGLEAVNEDLGTFATVSKYDQFAFNNQAVSAQEAAIKQVYDQYVTPLLGGVKIDKSKDVKGNVAAVIEKMKAAGIDKYIEEMQKQVDAYWTERGF
jgi:putative aldouronate transport system substrate-binding protein